MAVEEELGTSIPTVLERNISWVILNVVRILLDHYDGILHRMGVFKTAKEIWYSMYRYVQYVLVYTRTYKYVHVCSPIEMN